MDEVMGRFLLAAEVLLTLCLCGSHRVVFLILTCEVRGLYLLQSSGIKVHRSILTFQTQKPNNLTSGESPLLAHLRASKFLRLLSLVALAGIDKEFLQRREKCSQQPSRKPFSSSATSSLLRRSTSACGLKRDKNHKEVSAWMCAK